ncbi:hypothetical protein A6U87_14740 [Rhizobium sp. AC44/96]|uniref:DUF4747 family protein n=1 Tax=Rhizobium sp. AC44/96 TaxID=1841654 RepID=UPI00080FB7AC|nr:DUF4747 family protein [Rhizobium sp. AC44/96]OCJ05262.1 hypothetical protein A6U87_14740 [Rhizobium sp. AC44/96]
MSRPFKHEVAALNIRINDKDRRDYPKLIKQIADLKRGVRVLGKTNLAISYFDEISLRGIILKYDELPAADEWFNTENFDGASLEDLKEIVIPDKLKPNYARFYFALDPNLHVIAFQTYGRSKGLSTLAVEKYFKAAVKFEEITDAFGQVDADIIADHGAIDRILNLDNLKELEIIIRPPNSDDIGETLAQIIEDRLREQNAEEYRERLKTKGKKHIEPNERTRALAHVAGQNGEVKAKNLEGGAQVSYNSDSSPLKEMRTTAENGQDLTMFNILSRFIFSKVGIARERQKSASS